MKTVSKSVNYFWKYDFFKGLFQQIHIRLLPTVLILIIALFFVLLNS